MSELSKSLFIEKMKETEVLFDKKYGKARLQIMHKYLSHMGDECFIRIHDRVMRECTFFPLITDFESKAKEYRKP